MYRIVLPSWCTGREDFASLDTWRKGHEEFFMAGPCRPLVLVLLALASADGAGVRRVDFRDAATRRKLKRRTHGSLERPIVVQHALQGLEALRELATPAAIGALTPQLEGVKEGAAGTKLFCYWEKSAAAGFGRELATVAKRPWHAWTRRAAPMATAEFFWNSSGAVSRYWTDKISSQQSLGVDLQLLLCERLADSDSLEACLNADAAEARRFESGDADSTGLGSIESLWLSSKGTTAQLHYDMQGDCADCHDSPSCGHSDTITFVQPTSSFNSRGARSFGFLRRLSCTRFACTRTHTPDHARRKWTSARHQPGREL